MSYDVGIIDLIFLHQGYVLLVHADISLLTRHILLKKKKI